MVSKFFAQKSNLPYEEATYTLAGVGGAVRTYHAGKGGRIYTVPLMSSSGEQINVKALSVEGILAGKKGREQLKLNPKEFPHVPVDKLKKAGKSLPRKYLDLLIGNSDLGLQPVCNVGFGCKDCQQGRCLYRSHFGHGYIPLGTFNNNKDSNTEPKRVVALAKMSPIISAHSKVESVVKLATDNEKKWRKISLRLEEEKLFITTVLKMSILVVLERRKSLVPSLGLLLFLSLFPLEDSV